MVLFSPLFILLCKHVQSSILVNKADSDVSVLSKLCCASFFQNKLLQPLFASGTGLKPYKVDTIGRDWSVVQGFNSWKKRKELSVILAELKLLQNPIQDILHCWFYIEFCTESTLLIY